MNNQLAQITAHFQALCARHGLPVRISTICDENLPKVQPTESADGHHICLNLARIDDDGYAAHLGYHIGNILLPRLGCFELCC